MKRLENKVAIITGAAMGMGKSHARRFIAEGAKVAFTDINEEKGNELAKELGENALFIKHNVVSAADWERVVAVTEEKFGHVNVLVNNAGITMSKSLLTITEEEYRRIIDINQVSVFLGIKTVIPSMQKAGGGSIVNISSMNGIIGGTVGYTDSKFAVRGLTKAAALECTNYGIRVNSVHPGMVATPMIMQSDTKDMVAEFAKHIPLKRLAQPEDVTNMVVYLASDESSYSTGSEFIVDGGYTAM